MGASPLLFLQNLVVVMVVAAAATLVAQRLRQPVVLGYILAGVLVGPHTPWALVEDPERILGLAELGLIFLMFSLGLEFNFRKVQRIGATAVVAAALEIALMLAIGYGVGQAFGWSRWDSVFLGAILSVSSTTIIVKVLMEQGKVHEEFAEVAFGILVVEDLLAVVMAGVLGAGGEGLGGTSITAIWVVVFAVVGAGVGLTLVPRFVENVSKKHSEEVLVVTVVGLAFASALFAQSVGFSLALGAFIMGALIGESGAVRKVEHKVAPIRDLFSSTFFVAVGMLLDPALVWEHRWLVLAVTLLAIFGKIAACTVAVWASGKEPATALRVGFSMGQIGEFSFILAALGLALGVMSPHLYPVAVAVCALTTFTTPYLIRASEPVAEALQRSRFGHAGRTYRQMLQEARGPTGAAAAGRPGLRALIAAGWMLGLALGATLVTSWIARRLPGGHDWISAGGLYLTAVGMGFPAIMFQRAARELSAFRGKQRTLRHLAHPGFFTGGYRNSSVLASLATTGGLLLLGLFLAWQAVPDGRPPLPLLFGALAAAVGTVAVGGRRFLRLGRNVEEIALEAVPQDVPAEPLARLRAAQPWGMDAAEVVIREGSPAAYSALAELDLRARTGAIAAFVSRGGGRIPAPDPKMALLPGDRLVVVGRHDQIERAKAILAPKHVN